MVNPQAVSIRTKKLAVLIRDARQTKNYSPAACAAAMGVTPDAFEAYERGQEAPSLPELELLAFTLKVPIEHFWGGASLAQTPPPVEDLNAAQIKALRLRIIGVLLRQNRTKQELSLQVLAEQVGIPADLLNDYESGALQVPLPYLEAFARILGIPMDVFIDSHSVVGKWREDQKMAAAFLELPENLCVFLSKPVNRPYLELAMRLSEMSVDKLRQVAEGLLEITL